MKIKIFSFLLIAMLFFACGSDNTEGMDEIIKLEKSLEENPDLDVANALVEEYKKVVEANPDDSEANAKYLYRAASVLYRMNRFSAAESLLKQAIKDHYSASNTPNNALLLGAIYHDKQKNMNSAATVYQALMQSFPEHEEVQKAKGKLDPTWRPIDERIEQLALSMFNDSTSRIEYRIANDYINSCELYAMLLPENSNSPSYLHKAGETARSIRTYQKALELYEWIGDKYSDFEKAPQSLFLRAFTLDNDLKRYDEAKVLYEEFLQKYPEDDFADDTKFLLENLGKDDEEIINSFNQ
jgi:tetratricopeptide (TPR) repeat protein